GTHLPAGLVEVGDAPTEVADVDLLVVGAPTHALSLSRPNTRDAAAKQAPQGVVSTRRGLREWLESVERSRPRALAAPLGTPPASIPRLDTPRWLTGSAAKAATTGLRRLGYRLAAPPECFLVHATTGPLGDGELDRAHAWGQALAATLVSRTQQVG